MFTPSPDYLQQLFAYLQAGQQLLQQWTILAGSPPSPPGPFMSPAPSAAGPSMPPTPFPALPVPTAPDYAQQLFSYLQTWRQHLEQTANTPPAAAQTLPTAPVFGGLLQTPRLPHHGGDGGSDIPTKPDDNTGTKSNVLKETGEGPNPPFPPDIVAVGPANRSATQEPGSDRERLQILIPPFMDTGNQIDRLGQQIRGEDSVASSVRAAAPRQPSEVAAPLAGSAFTSAINRVDTASVQAIRPQTLFSQSGIEAPSG